MFLENFLKNCGIWAEFHQTLAKDDRQDCQNCIPGVDRNFLWNLFLRKKSPSFRMDFAWENCKVSVDKCRQSCRNCLLLVKKQKNTVRRKTSLFFRKNAIFKQFRVVSQFFWIFGQQNFGSILRIASFFVSEKATGGRKFDLGSFFYLLWISEQKRIRLLYKKIRQGCKDGNLNIQDVYFVWQNVFGKRSEKFRYLSRTLSDFGKRRSAGLSKLHSRCLQELSMKPFFAKKVSFL